jgi:hypothetical protein
MDGTDTGPAGMAAYPGRGARGGAAVAALTGVLYEVAGFTYSVAVERQAAGPDIGRTLRLVLLWTVASWLVATPATAVVGARLRNSPRRTLVAGYTLAAGASLTLFTVALVFVLFTPGQLPGLGAVAATAALAFGAAFVAAVLITRPRGRRPSDSTHPGGRIDPAAPEQAHAAANT